MVSILMDRDDDGAISGIDVDNSIDAVVAKSPDEFIASRSGGIRKSPVHIK